MGWFTPSWACVHVPGRVSEEGKSRLGLAGCLARYYSANISVQQDSASFNTSAPKADERFRQINAIESEVALAALCWREQLGALIEEPRTRGTDQFTTWRLGVNREDDDELSMGAAGCHHTTSSSAPL